MNLEDYLDDQYNRDLQDISAIEQVLTSAANMFMVSFDWNSRYWPYELKAGVTTAAVAAFSETETGPKSCLVWTRACRACFGVRL